MNAYDSGLLIDQEIVNYYYKYVTIHSLLLRNKKERTAADKQKSIGKQ